MCTDHDLPLYLAGAQVLGGCVMVAEDDAADGVRLIREGLQREQAEGGTRTFIAEHVCLLAEAHARRGELEEALATLDEAFAAIGDEEIWRSDLLRVRGDLILKTSGQNGQAETEAERCYREAVERAHAMGAKAFELRAATALARLCHARGRSVEAREILVPVYSSFTEGLATRDLKDARGLSEQL